MRTLMILTLAFSLAGVLGALAYESQRKDWEAKLAQAEQRDETRFREIQRRHGAVAVATDWSHALRLNGETIRLRVKR